MTRLHEALERAKAINAQTQQSSGESVEAAPASSPPFVEQTKAQPRGPVEPVLRPKARRPMVTEPATAVSESVPLAHGAMAPLSCPDCRSPHPGSPRWMRRLFGLLGLAPYRCRFCGRRFSELEASPPNPTEETVFSTFLSPEDGRSFQDLIRDMALEEQGQEALGPTSGLSFGSEWPRDVVKSEPRPAIGGVRQKHPRI